MEDTQIIVPEAVLRDLTSTDPQTLRDAAFMAADGHIPEAINLLCGLLLNDNVGVHEAAEFALRKLRGKKTVHGLIPLLRGTDVRIRNSAMDILREIGIDDVAYLKEMMQDEDANIRIYISDVLGYTGNRMVVSTLANALLTDVDSNVRQHAANSLGLLAFPECIDPLAQAIHDEEWVQFAAVESLTKIHDASTIDALIKILPISTDLVASTIINALGEIGNIKTIPLLFKSLETSSTPLRRKAVKAIIQILGEKSLSLLTIKDQNRLMGYLLDALNDEDTNIQLASLSGLAVMGDESVTATVLGFANNLEPDDDNENVIRTAAIKCIAKIGFNDCYSKNLKTTDERLLTLLIETSSIMNDRRCTEEIKSFFWNKQTSIQRLISIHISQIGTKEDLDFFVDILNAHKDDHIIKNAIVFLGEYADCAKCANIIFEMLNHPYNDIKEVALTACINIASPEIKVKFKKLYESTNPIQRLISVYALYSFDPENIAAEVKEALYDTDPKIRKLAIQCIGNNLKDLEENFEKIVECLNDEDSDVRVAVVELLGKSDNPKVVDHLILALDDEFEWVQIRAVEALGQIKATRAIPVMVQMIEKTTPMLTFTIIDCLGKLGGNVAFNALLHMMDHENKEIQNSVGNAILEIRTNKENS